MPDSIGSMDLGAVEATVGLTDLWKSVCGLTLDASVGGLSIGLKRFGCLRDLVSYELARPFGGISCQPHGLLSQEVASG